MTVRAVTRPLGDDELVDLEDVARGDGHLFVRGRVGVAARGCLARIAADDSVAFLAAIEHQVSEPTPRPDDVHSGTVHAGTGAPGPIAIGCLPFLPGADAELVVPAVVVRRDVDGRTWLTVLDGATDDDLRLAPAAAPTPSTSAYTIRPGVDTEHYLAAVTAARQAVRDGRLTKAVIARPVVVESDHPIDVHAVLRRLRQTFGSSHRFATDGIVGSSPELLVAVDGEIVRSHPLAGTAPRTGDPDTDARLADELIASTKNQVEHRVVVDVVHDTLLPWVSYLDWQPEPTIVTVANVQHLGSEVEGRLSQPGPSVIELARALSPTPALGGHPRQDALDLIATVEGFERGLYGGTVGWVDGQGNGTWAVTIRCAELSDDRTTARLVAGGGIVADSDPLAELAETQAKLQAMLSAIIRP